MYKNRNMLSRERRPRCTACRSFIDHMPNTRGLALGREDVRLPEPGDLTECHKCRTMLEYAGDPGCLSLSPAPQQRIDAFRRVSRERGCKPKLSNLVEYVMKYGQMPQPELNFPGRASLFHMRTTKTVVLPIRRAEPEPKKRERDRILPNWAIQDSGSQQRRTAIDSRAELTSTQDSADQACFL
jgi:hypothetical protein